MEAGTARSAVARAHPPQDSARMKISVNLIVSGMIRCNSRPMAGHQKIRQLAAPAGHPRQQQEPLRIAKERQRRPQEESFEKYPGLWPAPQIKGQLDLDACRHAGMAEREAQEVQGHEYLQWRLGVAMDAGMGQQDEQYREARQ